MTKEDNIIVPRWFIEVVENTLQIQNNINLNKKTGETCQDRNIIQSLNGIRKLLKGEELTGMERIEKLQPSLPSNLDEAAENTLNNYKPILREPQDGLSEGLAYYSILQMLSMFKAGAEWAFGQEKYESPKTAPEEAIEVTSRMRYLKEEYKPIADFILHYAYWTIHQDEEFCYINSIAIDASKEEIKVILLEKLNRAIEFSLKSGASEDSYGIMTLNAVKNYLIEVAD